MFDTFQGLPIHELVLHATVVLVPLMAVLTVLVAARPRLRAAYAWWVLGADVAMVVLVFVTIQSGKQFEQRLPASALVLKHAQLGRQLIWFVVALAVAALVVALSTRRGRPPALAGTVLSAVAAVLVLVWVVRTGHAGAQAAWHGLPPKR